MNVPLLYMCSADAVDGHILYEELVSNLFFRQIRKPFENNFYFMKTAKIPVYGNIALSV